jgi:hypothetical protein
MGSSIKQYPVDNGDQGLISVVENDYTTHIMVDCRIRELATDNDDVEEFDVKAELLKTLKKKKLGDIAGVPFTDNFILTHGDKDHLHGFEKHFYQGEPKNYKKKNLDAGEILIDTLWFSPMVMGPATNEDEKCFNREAKRRIKLHQDKSSDKDLPGNRIVIIGYDGSEKLDGLHLVRYVPGQIVSRFNDRDLKTFSIFIHSPYQQGLSDDDIEKNHVSIVFQARFHGAKAGEFSALVMYGGDSDHNAWVTILEKTKKYKNDVNQKALQWDILIAPHHCSWTFFNEHTEEKPTKTSLEVLSNMRGKGRVIASSKEILDDDDNPPSYAAKQQYVKVVGAENFLCTATNKDGGKDGGIPQPIVFGPTPKGPMPPKKEEGSAKVAGTAGLSTVKEPSSYGS